MAPSRLPDLTRRSRRRSSTRRCLSGPDHLTSMLVDDSSRTGTAGVAAPDLLIVQQVRGTGQAEAYADQISAKFGYPGARPG
ncbi:hypothetical protein [Plantactinospora sp. KLBMP9567]|uniref:hypothetical protein n=1 Tax=Plantactinospora sp. KLBMP9567 TaxID=3085900 RepID=UPI0029816E30|nr:hypothetical protein [Plantactinospora sp. KLBMP9567]MDW5330209.1 hypothetical protein [Plantactinospora sp. KLBMP9567]